MQPSLRRALAFALVATLALSAPVIGPLAAVPFALIAVVGRTVSEGSAFELFARPGDRIAGQLRGLVGFALAATGLALLASLSSMPVSVFVAAVLLLGYGNLGERVACRRSDAPIRRAVGFSVGGALSAGAGFGVAAALAGAALDVPVAAFLAITGALGGALLRAVLVERDDPLVMVSVGLSLWLLSALDVAVPATQLAVAVGIAGVFGYLSWLLGTASVTGMLTGVTVALLTVVLGGYGWFAVLIAFFAVGGFAAKFRYDQKRVHGVAEGNQGARGGRNVLGNAGVALIAVVGYAAGPRLSVAPALFLFAFAGSVSTAMSDTLSSEIGVLYGRPRLIISMEEVEIGTDGGVTLEGTLAGLAGALAVAGLSLLLLGVNPAGAATITVAGLAGMGVDSLLGATVEGRWIGNGAVNFLATLAGALVSAVAAAGLGLA